jgi:hypothetical protein
MESRLWNIQAGDDWKQICSTTPADFRGFHFDGPKNCDDRVSDHSCLFVYHTEASTRVFLGCTVSGSSTTGDVERNKLCPQAFILRYTI